MNNFNLNHDNTPDELRELNRQLYDIISAEPLDDDKLRALVEQRDTFIVSHLAKLDSSELPNFARNEYNSNQILSTIVEAQLKESMSQLSGLIRGQKAVQKYK